MAVALQNWLLKAYTREKGTAILNSFEAVSLTPRTVLNEAGSSPKYVHMITSGAISILTCMQDGRMIEAEFIGREGFPESLMLFSTNDVNRRSVVQAGGTALRMRMEEFEDRMRRDPTLRALVYRWTRYEALALTQVAACNGLHRTEQRLARWLLMVRDRLDEPRLPLTQELLAQMLGTRRATVTMAMAQLQAQGMIDSQRGNIGIRDRALLEKASCECYPVLRKLREGLQH